MLALLTNLTRAELITQLQEGLVLLVLGIGTVFFFLVLLIFATKLMSKVCAKISKSAPAAKTGSGPSAQAKSAAPQSVSDDAAIAIAIAAAYDKSRE